MGGWGGVTTSRGAHPASATISARTTATTPNHFFLNVFPSLVITAEHCPHSYPVTLMPRYPPTRLPSSLIFSQQPT